MKQTDLFESAPTRHGDPATSHKAAKSVTGITDTQWNLLHLLSRNALTDPQALHEYFVFGKHYDWKMVSESGLRSRRAELVRLGYVEALKEVKGNTGRMFTLWGLTEKGRQAVQGG